MIKNFVEKILKKPEKLDEIQIKKGKNADLTVTIMMKNIFIYILTGIYHKRWRKKLYFCETLWTSKYSKFHS